MRLHRSRRPLPRTGPDVRGRSSGLVLQLSVPNPTLVAGRNPDAAEAASGRRPPRGSSAQAEPLDDRAVAVDVFLLHVVQKAATLTHQEQQPTTAVMVVLVLLQVLGQVSDPVLEQGDLDLGRAGVALAGAVLGDDLFLGLRVGTCSHAQLLS